LTFATGGACHQLFYVKLPNILGLDQRPFDRDTFEAADEDELVEGPEGTTCLPACRACVT
jgi:hypothetical protein